MCRPCSPTGANGSSSLAARRRLRNGAVERLEPAVGQRQRVERLFDIGQHVERTDAFAGEPLTRRRAGVGVCGDRTAQRSARHSLDQCRRRPGRPRRAASSHRPYRAVPARAPLPPPQATRRRAQQGRSEQGDCASRTDIRFAGARDGFDRALLWLMGGFQSGVGTSGGPHMERRTFDALHHHATAGGRIRAFDAPDRVIDAHPPGPRR